MVDEHPDEGDPWAEAIPERVDEGNLPTTSAPWVSAGPATARAVAFLVILVAGVALLVTFLVRAGGPAPTPEELARQPLNPRPTEPPAGVAARGAPVYQMHCAACHGATGDGGIGPSLRARRVALAPDAAVLSVVRQGAGAMPAFDLTADEEAALLAYLAYLQGREPAPGGQG